jgi:hypothetical protein
MINGGRDLPLQGIAVGHFRAPTAISIAGYCSYPAAGTVAGLAAVSRGVMDNFSSKKIITFWYELG